MSKWTYEEAFHRNLGLISPAEQQTLKNSRVAVAGAGGVGGIELVTLARLGVGKFTLADFDNFEVANFNRQYGATVSDIGRPKVEVMARILREINPDVQLKLLNEPVSPKNIDDFLEDVNLTVDGIDAFMIEGRRLLFKESAARGIVSLTAGPLGFGTAFLIFDPKTMTAEDYFNFNDQLSPEEKFARFIIGVSPRGLQRSYMDYSYINLESHRGPSAAVACQLCAGVVGAAAVKVLLKRGRLYPAPYYHQFDPFLCRYVRGWMPWGNKNPIQKLKIFFALRQIHALKEKTTFPVEMGW